jgi:hypothetical protein
MRKSGQNREFPSARLTNERLPGKSKYRVYRKHYQLVINLQLLQLINFAIGATKCLNVLAIWQQFDHYRQSLTKQVNWKTV